MTSRSHAAAKRRSIKRPCFGNPQAGFTILELVLVLLLFGVLWLVELRTVDLLRTEFKNSYEKTVASSVQIGLLTYFVDPKRGNLKQYPSVLDPSDAGPCTVKRRCFENVLPGGITVQWKKTAALEYRGSSDKRHIWKYNPAAGEFHL